MRLAVAVLALGLLFPSQPALAWWDEDDCCAYDDRDAPSWEPPSQEPSIFEDEPAYEPRPAFEPEPLAPGPRHEAPEPPREAIRETREERIASEARTVEPAGSEAETPSRADRFEQVERAEQPGPAIDRHAVGLAAGLYDVNEIRVGDSVTQNGLETTYTTETQRADPGTMAKVVGEFRTGDTSGYESVQSSERLRLTDGRLVGGALFENFVWDPTSSAWRHSEWVWFQDDSELAQLPAPIEPPRSQLPPALPPAERSQPIAPPGAGPSQSQPVQDLVTQPGHATGDERVPLPAGVPATIPVALPPAVGAPPGMPAANGPPRVAVAAVALAPQADTLGHIEVLRGRAVRLWMRAFVDGSPATVAGWRLSGGEATSIGPLSGSGEDPFIAVWEHVAAGAMPYVITFDVSVSVPVEGIRTVPATISVVVRSPAIVE